MLFCPVLCFSISLYRSRRNSRVEVSGSSKWLSVLVISRRAIHRHRQWRRSEVYSWPNCTVQAKIAANGEERSKDWVEWRGCGGGEVLFGGRGQGPSRQHPFVSCILVQKILTRIIRQSSLVSPSPHSHPLRPPGDVDESRSTPKAYRGRGVWDVERQD